MKLARVIRFDRSDLNIFPTTADEGEWAIAGSFSFANLNPDDLTGKVRQAFANGFMGVPSFGYATLVSVSTASDSDVTAITDQLTRHFIAEYGAPSSDLACQAAVEEIGFMAEMCDEHKTGTLLSVSRSMTDEGISESFRSIAKADSCSTQQLWTIVEDDPVEFNKED
tara:strand:- start:1114 stop:1617 length:504 start_codon:yes stop_codon:yes gene_type:complete